MFALTEFWGLKLYHLCGVPVGKEINSNIDCNTPGIPAEANSKFLWREKTSGFTGKSSMKIRSDIKKKQTNKQTHKATLYHGQESTNTTKGRFNFRFNFRLTSDLTSDDLDPPELQTIQQRDKDYNVIEVF